MKIVFFKTIVCGALLLLRFNLAAQNSDYVILNSGDTIKCIVTGPSVFGIYKYKTSDNGSSVKIIARNVKEFYRAEKNELQRAVFFNRYTTFMTVIEKGKINLYQTIVTTTSYSGNMYYSNSNTQWYISKGSDTVKLLKNGGVYLFSGRQKHKNEFAEMLKDDKAVYDQYIAEDKFSFEQIKNLVHLYNTGLDGPGKPKDPD